MGNMFACSIFNKNISNWDVSNVIDMSYMFKNSKFNKDISKWNVGNVLDMNNMFYNSKFNKNISKWNVSKVKNMLSMFYLSDFNNDISTLTSEEFKKIVVLPAFEKAKHILEDFGMQGPEAVPGMGAVKLPNVATSTGDAIHFTGSGDMSGFMNVKKHEDDEDGTKLAEDVRQAANKYLKSLGLKHDIDGKLFESTSLSKEERNKKWSSEEAENFANKWWSNYNEIVKYINEGRQFIVESIGDISSEHSYNATAGGYFTKDELLKLAKAKREENPNWYAELCAKRDEEMKEFHAQRKIELTSDEKIVDRYRMLDISQAIMNLSTTIFDIYGFDLSDRIIQFIHKEIEETKAYLAESVNESLNNSKQKPLAVHFTSDSVKEMQDLLTCMNKPVKRQFKVIDTDFSCQTLEGITIGKAGDCLVVGVDGEVYPCDKKIFDDTYVVIDTAKIDKAVESLRTISEIYGS
jgi:surface protein